MARIAVISAVHEELAEILQLMPDERKVSVAGREFWQGHLQGHEVVAVLCGIGKVAAATTATVLHERFAPQYILFTGVAGGLAPIAEVGDVVVGTRYLQHDLSAAPLFPRWEVPGTGKMHFDADLVLAQVLEEAARDAVTWLPKLVSEETLRALGLHRPTVHRGLIVSGDRFITSVAESQALREALPEALAVDMESAAVAQVCWDYGTPFAAVRTLSDRADDEAHVDFQAFMRDVARHYSARIVRKALNLL
ncbi:5'-methylthioadenosine/S-adenosylhomocysteine nucleosidase [Tepidimonas thermarum]|uniref:adenosylhomocysteine nucleosidase n=1 Tax=Tepidimonas thermarum TaxID=335431 RepID=A0A554WWV1_9BURK|nr:5'-methylthioadenosine/adenosylhomocysteine nucleosidase [Tepidimonas thermarum]TSE28060.1 5'-methylthioadenosine/S-adenosylhomocysteine nucleosidase [Tepidimonas thermarum]